MNPVLSSEGARARDREPGRLHAHVTLGPFPALRTTPRTQCLPLTCMSLSFLPTPPVRAGIFVIFTAVLLETATGPDVRVNAYELFKVCTGQLVTYIP